MKENKILEELKSYLNKINSVITAKELAQQFNLKPNIVSNYLRRLETNGFITKKGKGVYVSYLNTILRPAIDNEVRKINGIIKDISPYMEFVIWSIHNFKNFYFNIPGKNYIFIEAKENYELNSIRAVLIEQNIESVLLKPQKIDFNEFFFRNEVPVILIKKKSKNGTIKIDSLLTPIIERMIIDLYFYITKKELPYPIKELGKILQKSIETGVFNFTFIDNYLRLRGGLEFDFLMIFSNLSEKYPYLIPEKYKRRLDSIKRNVNSFIGD
ncbi:MAG: DUF6577 family protein [Candidatus Helarchaeota archaeon]